MQKIAIALLGLPLIPSCQMGGPLSSSMKKAESVPVAGDVFVQALKDEEFEQAQSMVQAGKISVNEKVDISAFSELAEVRAAHRVAALLPLQVAAYWEDASLLRLIWEQDPALYTKQDIDLALAVAESQANLDAIDFLYEVSKNFADAGSSPAAGTAPAPIQEGEVDAEEDTNKMEKDKGTGTMQKDKEDTGTMQKDKGTGTMQKTRKTRTRWRKTRKTRARWRKTRKTQAQCRKILNSYLHF